MDFNEFKTAAEKLGFDVSEVTLNKMDFNEFKTAAEKLGFDVSEVTLMDAYANYEVNNCTIECALEQAEEDELYF